MSRQQILKEFEGGDVLFRVPRRPRKLVALTIRVLPDLVRQLGEEARRRGVPGHTTMARLLLEAALAERRSSLAEEIADAVVARLGRRPAGGSACPPGRRRDRLAATCGG
jgi:hypothetical protein